MGTPRTPDTDLAAVFAAEPSMLKTVRAAELCGVHQKTIERAVRGKRLEAVRPGKNYLIPKTALLRWLAKGIS